jgi:hypothetical protein
MSFHVQVQVASLHKNFGVSQGKTSRSSKSNNKSAKNRTSATKTADSSRVAQEFHCPDPPHWSQVQVASPHKDFGVSQDKRDIEKQEQQEQE